MLQTLCPRGLEDGEFDGSEEEIQNCRNVDCPYLQYQDGIYGCMKELKEDK